MCTAQKALIIFVILLLLYQNKFQNILYNCVTQVTNVDTFPVATDPDSITDPNSDVYLVLKQILNVNGHSCRGDLPMNTETVKTCIFDLTPVTENSQLHEPINRVARLLQGSGQHRRKEWPQTNKGNKQKAQKKR